MKCAVYYGPNDIRIEERTEPVADNDFFVLKTENCGVCGTDVRIFRHGHPQIKKPTILGHQIVGRIYSLDKSIGAFKEGDRVVISPDIPCGTCHWCRIGQVQHCRNPIHIGFNIDGGYAEYVRIPKEIFSKGVILKMPENISSEEGGLIEPFACVLHAIRRIGIRNGDQIAIIGAGPVGDMFLLSLKSIASKIIVIDIAEKRLKKAKELGADVTINSGEENVVDIVLEETEGLGADVVIVATSANIAQEYSLKLVRKLGKVNFFGALPPDRPIIRFESNLIQQNDVTVYGTYGMTHEEFIRAFNLVKEGKINLKPLITHRFTVDQIKEAFESVEKGEAIHATIYFK